MPGMDGIATTERISATFPATSIIMMSVQGEADYLRRSMLAGAREFLVKPFSSDELTASIRQVHVREKQKRGRMVVAFQGAAGRRRRWRPEERQGRHTLRAQGRGGPHDAGGEPGRGHGWRAASDGHARGRLLPVRGRGRPAQPQPEEQVDHRRGGRSLGRPTRTSSTPRSSTTAPASRCCWRLPARRWRSSSPWTRSAG